MANTDYTMYELYEYIQNPGIPVKGGENLTVHPNFVDWSTLSVGSTDMASYSYEFNVSSLFEVGNKHIDTIILQGTEGSTWKKMEITLDLVSENRVWYGIVNNASKVIPTKYLHWVVTVDGNVYTLGNYELTGHGLGSSGTYLDTHLYARILADQNGDRLPSVNINFNDVKNDAGQDSVMLTFNIYDMNSVYWFGVIGIQPVREIDIQTIPLINVPTYQLVEKSRYIGASYNSNFQICEITEFNKLGSVSNIKFDGNDGENSAGGIGGNGSGSSGNYATQEPVLPTIGALSSGIIKCYLPTEQQLIDLTNFLWSPDFFDNVIKNQASPMENIISLSVIPAISIVAGAKNIVIGNKDTNISSQYTQSEWVRVNCGEINMTEYFGNFCDYAPHTDLDIFLPFIGFQKLDTDDFMGGKIKLYYHVNVFTGTALAFIESTKSGKNIIVATFEGNCQMNIPISNANYLQYYTGIAQSVMSVAGGAAQAATGNMIGATQSIVSGIGSAISAKPAYSRSGGCSGVGSFMNSRKAYLMIHRPVPTTPIALKSEHGLVSNKYQRVGAYSGFTVCQNVILDGISATQSELDEIETLLKEGVII